MTFNSFVFVGFFVLVYAVTLATMARHRFQNTFLLVASLVFYGWWDWRFVSLVFASTLVDYWAALRIEALAPGRRRTWMLGLSMAANLSILGVFKYFDFFTTNLVGLLRLAGIEASPPVLHVILPLGISFYTFQAMSYTIDVYRGDLKALRSYPDFLLFVTFFPHMVAGPIQRPTKLIRQVVTPRRITAQGVEEALTLLAWGYFKKVVVADNVAKVADAVFDSYGRYEGLDLVIGALAFTVQIYCDFSGYTDIARGLAKLMGFDLGINFRLPYFATSPSDFWTRWHISLSTWLRDYLYVSLGGNRGGRLRTYRNLVLTMLLGGLWHGAAWNYVLWGAYHGALLVGYRLWDEARASSGAAAAPGRLAVVARTAVMFFFTVVGWVLFRSRSWAQIVYMLGHAGIAVSAQTAERAWTLAFFSAPLVVVDSIAFSRERGARFPSPVGAWPRATAYSLILLWIFVFGVRESAEFIYFQF